MNINAVLNNLTLVIAGLGILNISVSNAQSNEQYQKTLTTITIDSDPSNLTFSYQGSVYYTPYSFDWPLYSSQKVTAISPQAIQGEIDTLFQFNSWNGERQDPVI